MLLSKSCEYGLRALFHLARSAPGTLVPIRTISDTLGIPYHFLAKIVQALVGAGLLTSTRGPHGGVGLGRPATAVTLDEIVLALDGPQIFTECVLGLPGCGDRVPCPLHDEWAPARAQITNMFRHATLADVAERLAAGDFRLADLTAAARAAR